jgi:hypothetical protein
VVVTNTVPGQEVTVKEILPLLIGCVVGSAFVRLPRWAWPIGCLFGGLVASAINGELGEPLWQLFVSFDAAMVWLGAAVVILLRRMIATRAPAS